MMPMGRPIAVIGDVEFVGQQLAGTFCPRENPSQFDARQRIAHGGDPFDGSAPLGNLMVFGPHGAIEGLRVIGKHVVRHTEIGKNFVKMPVIRRRQHPGEEIDSRRPAALLFCHSIHRRPHRAMESVNVGSRIAWCGNRDNHRAIFFMVVLEIIPQNHGNIIANRLTEAGRSHTDHCRVILLNDVVHSQFQVGAAAEDSGFFRKI